MSAWATIDTAPLDGSEVLLWLAKPVSVINLTNYRSTAVTVQVVIGWWGGSYFESDLIDEGSRATEGWDPGIAIVLQPSHWMPIPQGPTSLADVEVPR